MTIERRQETKNFLTGKTVYVLPDRLSSLGLP